MAWIPLNIHSQYSILDSAASVGALAEKAKAFGMQALALTDEGNLYGAVDFYKACKGAGVKPILGCEIWIAPGARSEKKRMPGTPNGFPIVLLAKDSRGFQNLCKLSSIGFLEGFYYQPRIDKETLAAHREGLVEPEALLGEEGALLDDALPLLQGQLPHLRIHGNGHGDALADLPAADLVHGAAHVGDQNRQVNSDHHGYKQRQQTHR